MGHSLCFVDTCRLVSCHLLPFPHVFMIHGYRWLHDCEARWLSGRMLSSCVIAAWLEKLSWYQIQNEQVCHAEQSVFRFERSNGLDTALYKTYLYLIFTIRSPCARPSSTVLYLTLMSSSPCLPLLLSWCPFLGHSMLN